MQSSSGALAAASVVVFSNNAAAAPQSVSPFEPARLPAMRMAVMVIIVFGFSCTEAISNNVLALTLHRFTTDAFIIGAILALNPFFGFIGQPIAAYWGDRIWTPFGRRAVFLLIAAPIVAVCLAFIPLARELWHLAVIVLILQFFQDIIFGANGPLVADMMPTAQRAFVAGLLTIAAWLASVVVVRFGLRWVDAYEHTHGGEHFGLPLYWACAVVQIVLVAGGALLLKEPRPIAVAPVERFSFRSYFSILREHPPLRRLAFLNACHGIYFGSAGDFAVLFATITLGLSKSDFGSYAGWAPLIAIASALPAAWVNRKFARNRLLALFAIGQLIVCATCLLTSNTLLFVLMLWLNTLCLATREVTFRAFSTEFYPPGRSGQAMGAVQVFFGVGRMAGLLLVGRIISATGENYRVAWLFGGACAAASLFFALRLPEPRTGS